MWHVPVPLYMPVYEEKSTCQNGAQQPDNCNMVTWSVLLGNHGFILGGLPLTVIFRVHRQSRCRGISLIIIEISSSRFLLQMESPGCGGAREER